MAHDDTRQRLVDVGVQILEREGLPALSLRTIAREAGVSHGAPRHHFPTYAGLLAAIARSGIDDLNAELETAFALADARRALKAAARSYLDFAVDRPEMFTLISRHDLLGGAGGELREVTSRWLVSLADAMGRARGSRRAAGPTDVLALWAGVHGLADLISRRSTDPVLATVDPARALDRLLKQLALTR